MEQCFLLLLILTYFSLHKNKKATANAVAKKSNLIMDCIL